MSETFNIKELSGYLKCSTSELRKLIRNQSIPYYRIGNKIFFKRLSIENWISEQENRNSKSGYYSV